MKSSYVVDAKVVARGNGVATGKGSAGLAGPVGDSCFYSH
jgi:hypothetical protein